MTTESDVEEARHRNEPYDPNGPWAGKNITHSHVMNDVVEVVEVAGARRVNPFLDKGYILLAVQQGAQPKPPANASEQFTVRKFVVYVLGRPPGVEKYEPPS